MVTRQAVAVSQRLSSRQTPAKLTTKMRWRGLLWFNAVFFILPVALLASAVVEGRVELPKSHSAPVQAKRYEIVTRA
ncbi:MAG: hypothetical protein J2P56_10855, partial [Verrucomicrobia bacterium]|nr:hypothetical protein [Verrucomicrobiota bacterium]